MTDQMPGSPDQQSTTYSAAADVAAAPAAQPVPLVPPAPPAPPAASAPFEFDPARIDAETRAVAKKAGAESRPFRSIEAKPWMAPHLGADGLPAGVGRINWGAMLLSFWWALAYGMTQWALVAFAVSFLANRASAFLPDSVGLLLAIGQIAFQVWFGFAINRAYWAANPKMLTAEQFRAKQPKWIAIGLAANVLVYVLIFYAALSA